MIISYSLICLGLTADIISQNNFLTVQILMLTQTFRHRACAVEDTSTLVHTMGF